MRLKTDPECYEIIGAAMAVHKNLGHGFLEQVYHEALMIEFEGRQIPHVHEITIPIFYNGKQLNTHYRADFLCFDSVIVEIKAIKTTGNVELAQVMNYLKATRNQRALLLNFGTPSLEYNRITNKFFNSKNSINSSSFSP